MKPTAPGWMTATDLATKPRPRLISVSLDGEGTIWIPKTPRRNWEARTKDDN